jgi:hypothetical protein
MPQDQPDWDAIKKEADAKKAAADAQKAAADAEKAALDAQKALDAAKNPALSAATDAAALATAKKAQLDAEKSLSDASDPAKQALADQTAAVKAAKDLADAQKSAADAQKAKADAASAALKAQIGDVPASGYSGDVTLKDKAGVAEAYLLAGRAASIAAKKIADMIPAPTKPRTILLYASADAPSFQALLAYRAQLAIVTKALEDASARSTEADQKAPPPRDVHTEAVPLAAAGLGLDAINKLLGFFRTDYSVGGVDVTLDDSALIHALAGYIAQRDKLTVQLPSIYNPAALADAGSAVIAELAALSTTKTFYLAKAAEHTKIAQAFTDLAAKEKDDTAKAALLDKAKLRKAAADALTSAAGVYDSFFGKLTAADDKGNIPLTSVIRDTVVADTLKNGGMLLVAKVQKAAGSFYTKKNMWTLFGGMPFYNMGGVVVSFALLDGPAGTVLQAGIVPVHGGFVKSNQVQTTVEKEIVTAPKAPKTTTEQ